MKRILLTQNQYAIVDDDMYEYLNQWKWCAWWSECTQSFYAVRHKRTKGKRQSIRMAREVIGLTFGDKRQSDHIDHNTLDNRISNLRAVTPQQNQFNQRNVKGYSWNKAVGKYEARIILNGKLIYLGLFSTTQQAHNAYLEAKKKYHIIL